VNIHQIRNSTQVIDYAGKKFLVDPFLAEKGAYPPFQGASRDDNNPLESLPLAVEEIIAGIDAVIVTHTHIDHWDDAAAAALPKGIQLFSQNEEDAEKIQSAGFTNVEVLQEDTVFAGIALAKTKGEHGRGEIANALGSVSGVVFKHEDEKTLYIAGDTVWNEAVQEAIDTHKPEVIVLNAGANQFLEGGPIVMDKEDVYEVHKAAPEAILIAVHMESANHWALSRADLRSFADEKGMSSHVNVAENGELFTF
jgi:L-ascorbate metabolism protein UlaG (beta-lactamase superfamily)